MELKKLIKKGKINILKGFTNDDFNYLAQEYEPIVDVEFTNLINYLRYINRNTDSNFIRLIQALNSPKTYIMRYEEFLSIINNYGIKRFQDENVQRKMVVINNAIIPKQYYYFTKDFVEENKQTLDKFIDSDKYSEKIEDEEINIISDIYSDINKYKNTYFYSFISQEDLLNELEEIFVFDYIETHEIMKDNSGITSIELTHDTDSFLILIDRILNTKEKEFYITFKDRKARERYIDYVKKLPGVFKGISIYEYSQVVDTKPKTYRSEILNLFHKYWGPNYVFRELEFYSNPDDEIHYKKTTYISQGTIIEDIITQAEKAYNSDESYKDIFITAPTGAGKSILFQISALYISQKYKYVTIVISPLIALMKDQIDNMYKRGIYNATFINSSITQVEKEERIEKIKNGEFDIVYLAPETLLAYNIQSLIGERKIGLLIVDEAHIVTTWGRDFRPDYWYLGAYITRIRKDQQFPICALTATAVYYGSEDMYGEIINSLNMRSTNTYLGKVVRDNITFQYNVDNRNPGREEYDKIKKEYVVDKVKTALRENKKLIIYFPYVRQVEKLHTFLNGKYPGKIAIYHGQLDQRLKDLNLEAFKNGEKKVLLCTKAFGMGVDIPDIEYVYHYAITGNLNDYVQEFGRIARNKSIKGIVYMDYLKKDFTFVNQLFGMSAIQDYQLKAVLKRLYDLYNINGQRRNFLVTPNDFAQIFMRGKKNDEDEIERKLKTSLLLIEKDSRNRFDFPMVVSRPRSLFTTIYLTIYHDSEQEVLKSKFGKYFKRVSDGRKNELEIRRNQEVRVSDLGDTYIFNAKECWINEYPNLTFANFKYLLLNPDEKLPGFPLKNRIIPKYRLKILSEMPLKALPIELEKHVNNITDILDRFKDKGKMFSINEFKEQIKKKGYNEIQAHAIANSYIPLINMPHNTKMNYGRPIAFNQEFEKYQIKNRRYHQILRDLQKNNIIKSRMRSTQKKELVLYFSVKSSRNEIRYLYLAELFGLLNFELKGGDQPEIFVRINDPIKLERLSRPDSDYRNELLESVKRRHYNSVKIINKFISELQTDQQRWDFIEDYYLGRDVLDIDYTGLCD